MPLLGTIAGALLPIVGSLIQNQINPKGNGIGSAFGTAGSVLSARAAQNNENQFNAQQAQINRDWQVQQMKYQNRWQSEGAQMQRMLAAGITPSSAAQRINPTSSANPSGGSAATIGASIAPQLAQIGMNYFQMKSIQAQTNQTEINTSWIGRLNKNTISRTVAEINLMKKQGKYTDEQARQITTLLPLMKDKTAEEVNQIKQNCEVLQEQVKLIQAQTGEKESEAAIAKIQSQLASDFGILPGQDVTQMIITAFLQDKGGNVINAAIQALQTTATAGIKGIGGMIFPSGR